MESIKGKTVFLAGATGGIGEATAKLLASSGARLFITGRNREKLEKLAAELRLSPQQWMAADISRSEEVQQLYQHYTSSYDTLDVYINASGLGIIRPVEQLSDEDFLTSLHTNLYGSFLLVRAFLPMMKAVKKGLIIHIPGVLGKVPMAGAAAYSASKYGLVGMMQSIREELKRTDIRITNLYLGGVDSPFWDNIDLRVPKEKMIREEEAAKAIWFLCQQPLNAVVSEMALQPFYHQAI